MRILLIEDDVEASDYLAKALTESGHVADQAKDGRDGLFMALSENYDVLIVDRMLPGLDGLSILKSLRASNKTTPVLILSALGKLDDRVTGLRAGGDDYLVKPYAFSELLARVEALGRRSSAIAAPASRAIWSSPTSRTAKADCAICTRCSGWPSTSIACATSRIWSITACSMRRS